MRMLKILGLGILVLIVLFVGIGLMLPRQVKIERSITIDRPAATVFAVLNGFKRFNEWSPWAAKDPAAQYTFTGPTFGAGAKLSWEGDPKTVGSGSQAIRLSVPYSRIGVDLDFDGQGKGKADFALSPEGSGTRVVWSFDTDLGMSPLSRWFGLMFESMIGPDYEQGLARLKELVEQLPVTDIAGLTAEVVEVEAVPVAYVEASCGKDEAEIGRTIADSYAEVTKFLTARKVSPAGPPITINTRWDDSGYGFEAALPVDRVPDDPPAADARVRFKQTYAGRAIKVVHRGAYRDMPPTYDKLFAWAAAHGFKQDGPPWDEYVSDPGSTPEAELITNVYLPVE